MENSADKIMEDTIADFERRIVAIQKVKQTQGRSAAVAQYVPSCRGNDNLYCGSGLHQSAFARGNDDFGGNADSGIQRRFDTERVFGHGSKRRQGQGCFQ